MIANTDIIDLDSFLVRFHLQSKSRIRVAAEQTRKKIMLNHRPGIEQRLNLLTVNDDGCRSVAVAKTNRDTI